ncbi:SDR family oxidoreductase [Methylorubrum populi]|uniref:SDR family oxidoreductase n=2 Tax=Methylobacteriaceae TaxID=119045 RepID=UPI002F35CAF4
MTPAPYTPARAASSDVEARESLSRRVRSWRFRVPASSGPVDRASQRGGPSRWTAPGADQPERVAKFEERIPMSRAEPDDISGAVAFLASKDAHFVTGGNLPVDGGRSASNGLRALI